MQPHLGIRKRFIRSLLRVDRCSLSWASGRGLTEAEVYSKIISGGEKQLRLGIWQRFIPSLLVGDRSS